MKSAIYTITNILNNKMYVGYAIDYKDRWMTHRKKLRKGNHENSYLQSSWNKYGEENFKFEILVECEEQFLCSEEHYWCNILNVHNRDFGYNIKPTNPNGNPKLCKETIEKIVASNKSNNRKCTEENKELLSALRIGTIATLETRLKMSLASRAINKNPLIVLTRNSEFVAKFDTIIDAAKFLGYNNITVGAVYRGVRAYIKDYIIVPEKDYVPGLIYTINFREKKIRMLDVITKEVVAEENSIRNLCKKYNLMVMVVKVLNGKRHSHRGYTYERII